MYAKNPWDYWGNCDVRKHDTRRLQNSMVFMEAICIQGGQDWQGWVAGRRLRRNASMRGQFLEGTIGNRLASLFLIRLVAWPRAVRVAMKGVGDAGPQGFPEPG